ncbi:hypothetical protein GGR56DRAFT_677899 [Xylariaceae sp. FL0804]|nr:hypothetical protein GGR56DRAFT_677899 [Xylariaceae sp. FL0804]
MAAASKPLSWLYQAPKGYNAARIHVYTGKALGASMWFFLMYRAKKDGPALLGWKHPWDH